MRDWIKSFLSISFFKLKVIYLVVFISAVFFSKVILLHLPFFSMGVFSRLLNTVPCAIQ